MNRAAMRGAAESLGRRVAAQPLAFLLAFVVLALVTVRMHTLYPLSYGLDFHYHLMSAAMNGRSSSEPVAALYHSINPLDSNTLIYTIAWPFEKLTSPVRAFQIACTIVYYVGYPLGVAYALVRVGRSPWGSLLAFPLSYGLTSITTGFWPFLSAATLMAPAMAEMEVLHRTKGKKARNALIACAVFCVLTFLGHAMVYGLLSILLAIHTLAVMRHEIGLVDPIPGIRRAFWVGVRSLGVILPSALVFGAWYLRVIYGASKAKSMFHDLPQPPEPAMSAKIFNTLDYLAPTTNENEHLYMAVLGVVAFAALIFGERARESKGPRIFERSFLLAVLAFVVLPAWYHYETVASRMFDLAVLLFPLVLFPRPPRLRTAGAWAAAAVFAFSLVRLRVVGEHLKILNETDYAGLLQTAETCKRVLPRDRARFLAYVNGRGPSKAFRSGALAQVHETFAAACGLDTPVYDTQIYPRNLLALRYVGAMPAPLTIINGATRWYDHPDLWKNFDYVLVYAWQMTPADDAALSKRAELVAKYGDFQLWGRK